MLFHGFAGVHILCLISIGGVAMARKRLTPRSNPEGIEREAAENEGEGRIGPRGGTSPYLRGGLIRRTVSFTPAQLKELDRRGKWRRGGMAEVVREALDHYFEAVPYQAPMK
jgi:hypothetical protein